VVRDDTRKDAFVSELDELSVAPHVPRLWKLDEDSDSVPRSPAAKERPTRMGGRGTNREGSWTDRQIDGAKTHRVLREDKGQEHLDHTTDLVQTFVDGGMEEARKHGCVLSMDILRSKVDTLMSNTDFREYFEKIKDDLLNGDLGQRWKALEKILLRERPPDEVWQLLLSAKEDVLQSSCSGGQSFVEDDLQDFSASMMSCNDFCLIIVTILCSLPFLLIVL
jgi:hypothetical protein